MGLEPTNMEYLYAMADFYIKRNRLVDAKKAAEKLVAAHPDQKLGNELLDLIERRLRGNQ